MSTALDHARSTATAAAGLCLTRVLPAADAVPRVGPWIVATMDERLDLPPLGVIADLGALLLGATLRTGTAIPGEDAALTTAVRRYEDAVLGRLAVDGRFASASFAVARLPKEKHAHAVGILVAGVLRRIELDGGVELPPGIVRQLTERKPEEALQRGYAVLRDDALVRQWLAETYAAIARGAQRSRELIGEADLFALENLVVLERLTQRLAVADVVRAQEAIGATIPRRLPRRRRNEGDVASKLEDESVYPAGGFASVSTSGSLENLVTSELIYMDPPKGAVGGGGAPGIDLFDMRYVEGELLYYTRDEAILVRRRRLVIVALAPDLVRARVKDRNLPWQRIVLVLALVVVLTKKLTELLGEEALEIRVVFLHEEGARTPLADERALAELILREWRDKGTAAVVDASWSDVVELTVAGARRGLVEVVHIQAGASAAMPSLDRRVVTATFSPNAGSLDAWTQATCELLSTLL